MEHPIKFITLDGPVEEESSKFKINEEAIKKLEEVEGNVAVISIAGLYRTGKSFVLNQLAGAQKGFDVGSTVEPCTEGIWLWIIDAKKAHPSLAPNNLTIVLLDTEGLGSYQKTATHDIKIFSISVLLSSFFVYNSLGTIDDTAMDKLSLVVELTKYIRAQSGDNERDLGQLSLYFPKFMWLVRDFSLELIAEGKKITPEDYLERALTPTKGDDEDIQSKNTIRQTIVQAFRDRTCYTLKRPVNDEELLQNLENVTTRDFRPEYLEQMKVLTQIIYRSVPPKRLYGHSVTGPILAELARSYVTAINAGGVPTISSAWDSVVKIEGAKALEAAIALYEKKMDELRKADPVMEIEGLKQSHLNCFKAAKDLFRTKAVGENIRSFEDELQETIEKSFLARELENWKRSSDYCKELVKKVFRELSQQVLDGSITTTESLETSWKNTLRNYEKESRGPAKYIEFFKASDQIFDQARKVSQLEVGLAEEKALKKFNEEKDKAKKEYERLEKLYSTVDQEWKKSEEDGKNLRNENKGLITEMAKMEKKVKASEAVQQENAELRKKISELEAKIKQQPTKSEKPEEIQPAESGNKKEDKKKKKKKGKGPCVVM